MEKVIYDRQVTKQSLSKRVVDTEHTERLFTGNDLENLFEFKESSKLPVSAPRTEDIVMQQVFSRHRHFIDQVHIYIYIYIYIYKCLYI